MLAAATLDVNTSGRVEMGLGMGGYWDGIVAVGGPRRTPRESVDALIEGIRSGAWANQLTDIAGLLTRPPA